MQSAISETTNRAFDRILFTAVCGLLAIGLLMVYSSSIVIAERQYGQAFYFLTRQVCFLGIGVVAAFITFRIPLATWQRLSPLLLIASILLLILVLIPGVGHEVNGSMRWLRVGPIGVQISELVKLFMAVYIADYCARHQEQVQHSTIGFIKPLIIWALLAGLLLLEPNFGATTVILAMFLGVLFLAGVSISRFIVIFLLVSALLALLAVTSHYRFMRLTSFLHPWAHQYDSGYQLTQSLIAFGRGGWFGVGLGESIQKLFYLPEAHTDFIFAVLAEELGLLGELLVVSLFVILVTRALCIGRRAYRHSQLFSAYLAYGIGLWLGLQALVNIGVTTGALPTKGLTLPFMSYGGSSLVVDCLAIALLFRIHYETTNHC